MSTKKDQNRLADITDGDYDEKVLKKRQRQMACKICCDLLLFASFLLAFTIVVMAAHNMQSALMVSRVKDLIKARDEKTSYDDVMSVDTFYDYMQNSFFKSLYESNDERTLARQRAKEMNPLDISNRCFGTVQIRQKRVMKRNNCQNGPIFSQYRTQCYKPYADLEESTESYGHGEMNKFVYDANEMGSSLDHTGKHGTYGTGGFFMPISTNGTRAMETFTQYKKSGYIDAASRAVFVDFTVWNSNLDLYAVTRVLFEFPAIGQVYATNRVLVLSPRVLIPFASSSATDTLANVMEVVVIIFVLWYVAEELSEISLERWAYFQDGWNILDWTNLILLLIQYMYRVTVWMNFANMDHELASKELSGDEYAYTDFQGIAARVETARAINSINAVLLWAKCIKYVAFFPYIQFLFHTVKDAMGSFFLFIFVFSVMATSFTIAFMVAFGEVIEELQSFVTAFVYLLRSVVADITVLPIYEHSKVYGAILILLFFIVILLVGLNVFFSIMSVTLMEETYAKDREKDPRQEAILVVCSMISEKIGRVVQLEKRIRQCAPGLAKKIYGDKKKKKKEEEERRKTLALELNTQGLGSTARSNMGKSTANSNMDASAFTNPRDRTIKQFTPRHVMQSVENMAGRVLSKIHACGIEIRIEVLRVQESLNQMVAIAKALSVRVEKIKAAQDKFLKDFLVS